MCCLLNVACVLSIFTASKADMHGNPGAAVSQRPAGQFRTPHWLVGNCSTVWTSVPGYYRLPYDVQFEELGRWKWNSPFLNKDGAEIGAGMFLSDPIIQDWGNGSWAASARDASRYSPGGITTCCCMYVGAHGRGAPIVLSEYCAANVKGKHAESMADVCTEDAPVVKPCPADNATLRQVFGDPFIEVYSSCTTTADAQMWLSERVHVLEPSADPRKLFSAVLVASAVSVLVGLTYVLQWFRGSGSSGLAGDMHLSSAPALKRSKAGAQWFDGSSISGFAGGDVYIGIEE